MFLFTQFHNNGKPCSLFTTISGGRKLLAGIWIVEENRERRVTSFAIEAVSFGKNLPFGDITVVLCVLRPQAESA